MEKICTKCEKSKSFSEFHKAKKGKYGLTAICKECKAIYGKNYYDPEKRRKYNLINAKRKREYTKQYRKDNPEKCKISVEKCYAKNSDKYKITANIGRHKRRQNDPVFKLNQGISINIRHSLKGKKNGRHWETLVNFTQEDLRQHLEAQFKGGMTWDNYGKWHIDHIIPKSIFNITSAECKGFKQCWALENLQPLWARDNILKSNKLFYS